MFYGSDLELAMAILERLPVTRIEDITESDLQLLNSFELTTLTVREKLQQVIEPVSAQELDERESVKGCCCKDLAAKMELMSDRLERIEGAIDRLLRIAQPEGSQGRPRQMQPIRSFGGDEARFHTQSASAWDVASGNASARRAHSYDGVGAYRGR